MLSQLSILIAEDEALVALELAYEVADRRGKIVGPVASVADGLSILGQRTVTAAVLDANLRDRDVTPLALALIERRVPFVLHTGTGIPAELRAAHPHLTIVPKPATAAEVLDALESLTFAARPAGRILG